MTLDHNLIHGSTFFPNRQKRSMLSQQPTQPIVQQPTVQQPTQPIVQQPTVQQPTNHTEVVQGTTYPVVYSKNTDSIAKAIPIGWLEIPENLPDGATISDIGKNPNISILVPSGIRGKVVLKGNPPEVIPPDEGGKSRKKKRRSTCKKRTKKSRRRR